MFSQHEPATISLPFLCGLRPTVSLSLVVEIVDAANKHMSNGGGEKGGRQIARREGQSQNLPNLGADSVCFLVGKK